MVQPDRPQMTIWCMRIACWISKATNTRSQYVILIALPLQQWLHERVSMLRYSTLPVLLGFRSGAAEVSVLLGYSPRNLEGPNCSLTFQDNLEVSSPQQWKRPKRILDIPILEDGTKMLHRNISNHLPSGAASYPRTKDTSDRRYCL